jgi:hypothetical protein
MGGQVGALCGLVLLQDIYADILRRRYNLS